MNPIVGNHAQLAELRIAGGIDFNLCRALYFMSGLLIIAGVVFFSSTATAPANAKKGK